MMTTFLLLPGGGGEALYWAPVTDLLQRAGHEAIAAVVGRPDVVLAAHSLGGFTAPLVAARVPLRALVFVNAMIPLPGESASAWGGAVGSEPARVAAAEAGGYSAEFDLVETFLHDVPAEVLDPAVAADGRDEAEIAFT